MVSVCNNDHSHSFEIDNGNDDDCLALICCLTPLSVLICCLVLLHRHLEGMCTLVLSSESYVGINQTKKQQRGDLVLHSAEDRQPRKFM